MTTRAQDLSNYDGQPVILYQFSRTSRQTMTGTILTTYYRYTSADRDWVDASSNVWKATAISDDGVRQSGDTVADQLTISMPYTEDVPQMFVGSPPSDPLMANIRQTNVDQADSFLLWAGQVGGVSRAQDSDGSSVKAQVLCNTQGATMDRAGVRLAWSRQCPHDLYGFECRADPTLHVLAGPVTSLDATHINIDEVAGVGPGASFNGGFIEWLGSDGHANRLGIVGFTGTLIKVLGTTDRLDVGTFVWAFLGCDRTRSYCQNIMNNIANHGGHDYMPNQNPFTGDLIF